MGDPRRWTAGLAVALCAVVASPPTHAAGQPLAAAAVARTKLLIYDFQGQPPKVRYRPTRFTLQHFSMKATRWRTWTTRRAVGTARVTASFGGSAPSTSTTTVALSRSRAVCGVRSYTVLRLDGEYSARLVPREGFCSWVVQ